MFRGAGHADPAEEEVEEIQAVDAVVGKGHGRAFTVSFLVLFAAEWGDLSQLTTASLSAKYDAPVEVWLGAWLALSLVAGLAALAGRSLVSRVRFAVVQRISGTLLALLALVTLAEAAGAVVTPASVRPALPIAQSVQRRPPKGEKLKVRTPPTGDAVTFGPPSTLPT